MGINYLFKGDVPPVEPIERSDANNDCAIGMGDIVYLIDYLFNSGDSPECCWFLPSSEIAATGSR